MNERVRREIREWIESLVVAVILALVIRTFVVQAFKIPTGSMRPTLLEGDRILVNKFIYGTKLPFSEKRVLAFSDPEKGDIIPDFLPDWIHHQLDHLIHNWCDLFGGLQPQEAYAMSLKMIARQKYIREMILITIDNLHLSMISDVPLVHLIMPTIHK